MTINTNTYLDNRPEGIETWIEPESQLRYSKHPHNKVIAQTPSGSSFHIDSTPEYEHHRLQHRSGSYTEVQNDGTEVHKIVGDGYEIITRNKNVLIKGYCNITIEGNCKAILYKESMEIFSKKFVEILQHMLLEIVR